MHILLFCAHTLCLNYVTDASVYWLVSQSEVNNHFVVCTVKAKKREQKFTTKKFVWFHNYSLY